MMIYIAFSQMPKKVAKNKEILKKRIQRLLFSQREGWSSVFDFMDTAKVHGDLLLFGGAVRDVALQGIRKFDSDLDFVFVGDREKLQALLEGSAKKNRFGGFRKELDRQIIDIWHIEDTWAFKNDIVKYRDIYSIINTTITNWESIFYSIRDNYIYCSDDYFENLCKGRINIVLEQNPNELGALVRIFRHFLLKEARSVEPDLCKYVVKLIGNYSTDEMLDYERESYSNVYLNKNLISYVTETFDKWSDEDSVVEVESLYKTKLLFPDIQA